jgi:hypothetical protein
VLAGQLGFGELYDAYHRDELDNLRHRLDDVDLADHLAAWQAWFTDRIAADTAAHYLAYVRTLIPAGAPFWRSAFTGAVVAPWLATRTSLAQKRAPAAQRFAPRPAPH